MVSSSIVLEVAFRLTEMGLEQLDEFSSSLLVALPRRDR